MESTANNEQNGVGGNPTQEQATMAQNDPKADKDVKMTQEELDKIQKEIEANTNYQNELKKEQE